MAQIYLPHSQITAANTAAVKIKDKKYFFIAVIKQLLAPLIYQTATMKQSTSAANNNQSTVILKLGYGLFLLLALYLFMIKDYNWAVMNFALALTCDPFDTSVSWRQRPLYQRVWLMVHLTIALGGLLLLFIH